MNIKTQNGRNLISDEEEVIAAYLKEHYLDYTNSISDIPNPKKSLYTKYGKRILDLLISIPAFIVLFPLNAIFCFCTFLDVGKPVFYKQKRIGYKGKSFTLVKFRNMNEKKDENGNLLPAKERVTRFGRFMRKYSFDELLNFWSIIKGDMSIIGPRPLPAFFYERMSERHKMRAMVHPGLECPRMIGENEDEVDWYEIQFENDVWYVENISLLTDIKMLFKLFKMTFDSAERGKHADTGTYFAGYNHLGQAICLRVAREEYKNYCITEEIEEKK